ncbi:histamine H2 receptor-like [Ruditapes philippinarum]|uniref:histamine H2 receptor-like n=1 Tax=Ruditapes philippinarum TaxID=129788 RepID=UPI00295BB665|nr:histamine H2 receptor-like [Ruditapes philippinarum]
MNSLICTDLSMGLFMCPFCIYSALYKCWPYSETFCKIEALFLSALFHESTLSLVLIALDRYFSVHHYLKYNSFMTSRKYVIVILATWTVTFGVYSIVIFFGEQFYFDDIGINCEPYYENPNVTLSVIVIFYFIPALLFLYSYGSIFAAANRKETIRVFSRNARHYENSNHAVSQILRTSKYLAAITAGFFVAVTPWTICTLTIALTQIKLNEDIDFAVTWIAISNSFWNVVIYSIMNRKFRQAAISLTTRQRYRQFLQPRFVSRDRISDSHDNTYDSQRHTELSNIDHISGYRNTVSVSQNVQINFYTHDFTADSQPSDA